MAQTVFLTGASSGIGRAAAELLASRGFEIWATSRDTARLPRLPQLHPLALDLERPDSIDAAWNRAVEESRGIDILVQNAGAGICGSIEDVPLSEAARQWQILVGGPLQLLRLAAGHMRIRRAGVIVGVSSLAAELPMPFAAHYSAGKSALSVLLAGLGMELKPFGVRVVDLRPGDIRTAFNDGITPMLPPGSPYAPWTMAAGKESIKLMQEAPGPELAARAILDVIERPRTLARCGTFFQARLGALGVRLLSRGQLLNSIRRYYHLDRIDREAGENAVKRLLVLTSATGAGHDTHALATAAWCARLYGTYVSVTVAHALEDSHAFYRGAIGFYNVIQRRAPWFHHAYYNVIELLDALNHGNVGLGRAYIVRLLQQTKPDAVLSVHDCLNRGYFELAREVLGPAVQCATYCAEFEGGYGFSRNWVNPRCEFFFGRTDETAREAQKRGAAQVFTAGHWAPPSFYDPPAEDAARTLGEFKLDSNRFTLLLSTGGAGAQNHRSLLRALNPLHARLQVVALCGRDDEARARLEAWIERETSLPVRCLGFTDRMPALLRAASAVVARAGATTAGEALICGCPVIFNGLGGMMPQELPTWRWFRSRGIGFAALTPGAVRDHVVRWLERPDELAAARERMARVRDITSPQPSLEKLLGL